MSYYYPNQNQYTDAGYIAPQQLSSMKNMHMHNMPSSSQHHHSAPVALPKQPTRGAKLQDVGNLQPGAQHQLSNDPVPTPQSIIDGTYQAALQNAANKRDVVTYVPRLPQHSGAPSLPSILFSVNGRPGPYLRDVINGLVVLDGAYDLVFRERVWKQTSLTIDWPGVTCSQEYIPCMDKNRDLTRTEVAHMIVVRVADVVSTGLSGKSLRWGPQVIDANSKPWNLKKIDYRAVRLIAINYYRKTWIPVLAVNA